MNPEMSLLGNVAKANAKKNPNETLTLFSQNNKINTFHGDHYYNKWFQERMM